MLKNNLKSTKLVNPKKPYNKTIPKANNPEAIAPKIKYFNEASVEYNENLFKQANV